MSKNRVAIIYFCLALVTFLAFWRVNHFDFINYDDPSYITENIHVLNGLTLDGVKWAFTAFHSANWHPLTWMSLMLDVKLYGPNPHWMHLMNLLFHIANALLLFLILSRATKAHWQSAFVAALFALHPLHVESVTWLAERKDVLSAFFWMLILIAYYRYTKSPGLRKYQPVFLLFTLGLMAKPMLVTLPFVLLLLDYWPLRRFENAPSRALLFRLFWEKIPLFALTVLSSIVTLIAQGKVVESLEALPLSFRIENAMVSYATYLGETIWPHDLAIFYPLKQWQIWEISGAFLILIAITFMVIRAAKRFPYLIVGWFWYIIALLPVIGLVQVGDQARADRYTYIPLIGLFIMAAWGIPELLKKWRYRKQALIGSAAFSLSCLFIATWGQIGYWKNSITLFEHAIKVTDNNYIAYNNLGLAYAAAGRQERAIADYNRAIEIAPEWFALYSNRGSAYQALGEFKQALADYDMAISIAPAKAMPYYNRGTINFSLGNYRQAIADYSKSIKIDSAYAQAYLNRGVAYAALNDYKLANADFDTATEIDPQNAEAYYNRGTVYYDTGNYKQAITNLDMAIEINPAYEEAYSNRGAAYAALGNDKQAIADFDTAIGINPEDAEAWRDRGVSYKKLGGREKSYASLKKAAILGDKAARNYLKSKGINW